MSGMWEGEVPCQVCGKARHCFRCVAVSGVKKVRCHGRYVER